MEWSLFFAVVALAAGPLPHVSAEPVTLDTPFGPVKAEAFGPNVGTAALVVAIHGYNPSLAHEWRPVAQTLGEQGTFRVLVPDLHSNPATAPGRISSEDFGKLAVAIANGQKAVWMGKSWGGASVARFAASHPWAVERLVLDAPGLRHNESAELARKIKAPTLLLWAQDDPVIPFRTSTTWRNANPAMRLHAAKQGGHLVLANEYTSPVLQFLKEA